MIKERWQFLIQLHKPDIKQIHSSYICVWPNTQLAEVKCLVETLHFDFICQQTKIISIFNMFDYCCPRLYKTPESGNWTKMSDEKWCSANSRYLEHEKW